VLKILKRVLSDLARYFCGFCTDYCLGALAVVDAGHGRCDYPGYSRDEHRVLGV